MVNPAEQHAPECAIRSVSNLDVMGRKYLTKVRDSFSVHFVQLFSRLQVRERDMTVVAHQPNVERLYF
jgi:hypothetical protein